MQEKVVVHYRTGALLKGFATNFNPDGGAFTMTPLPADTSPPVTVDLSQLKAVFFVRDFTGDANYDEVKAFEPSDRRTGRRIEAVMYDGETLVGSGRQLRSRTRRLLPRTSRSPREQHPVFRGGRCRETTLGPLTTTVRTPARGRGLAADRPVAASWRGGA